MNIQQILFFYVPMVTGVYYYFKDIKMFALISMVSWGFGVNILGINSLLITDVFHLMIFLYLFDFFIIKKSKLLFDKGGRLLSIFFLFFIVGIIIGQNHDIRRSIFNKFFLYFDYIFFLSIIRKPDDFKKLIKYSILSVVITMVLGIITYFFRDIFKSEIFSYQFYLYEGGQRFGYFNSAYILYFFSLVFLRKSKKFVVFIISLALIFISGSRTSLILIIIATYAYYFIKNKKKYKKTILQIVNLKYLVPLTAILILFALYLNRNGGDLPIYFMRYSYFVNNPIKSGGGREATYHLAFRKIKQNPILGNIIENRKILRNTINDERTNAQIHAYSGYMQNAYLANLYAYGLIGLSLMLYIIFYFYKNSKKIYIKTDVVYDKYLLFLYLMVICSAISGLSGGGYFSVLISPLNLALLSYIFINKKIVLNSKITIRTKNFK